MTEHRASDPRDLPGKPLVEAIFELRWTLETVAPGMERDPAFRILLGRFYDKVKGEYPAFIELPASQVPEEFTARVVRHQFRPGADAWPVIQLGPGILTVNETKAYTWATFSQRVKDAIRALFDAYPRAVAHLPLTVLELRLRYINAIKYNPAEMPPLVFLRDRLHIGVEVDPVLLRAIPAPRGASAASLNLTLPLEEPSGAVALLLATGQQNGDHVVRWETIVSSGGNDVARDPEALASWLDKAHSAAEACFFTLGRGWLMEQFSREP